MKGKEILIAGASSGIGAALGKKLAEQGAIVHSISRSEPTNFKPASHCNYNFLEHSALPQLPAKLNGLVYCPGSITLRPFVALKPEQFLLDFQLNALGAAQLLQHTFKALKLSGQGSVVLFSTVAVTLGMSYHSSIAMAKGAIEGLTRSLAAEWSTHNIRVNALAPSLTDTPLAGSLLSTEDKRIASDKRHPLGRIGTPEDLAQAANFLLSNNSSWLTGQIIHLDGGMSSIKTI